MSKVRVYELARKLNVDSKTMVARLKQMGIDVTSHQSTLTDEQVALAQKAIKTGVESAGEAKAKTVVIRRRRRAAESNSADEPKEEQTPSEASVAPVAAVTEPREKPQAMTAEAEVADQKAEEASEPKSAKGSADDSESSVTESQAAQEAKATETKASRVRAASNEGGATIVRRASPEEVAKRQKAAQDARDARDQSSRGRREDSRGVRVSAPASASGDERVTAFHSENHEEANRTWGRKSKGGRAETEEEERARKAAVKQKRSKQVNMRDLLSQIDGEDEEGAPAVRTSAFDLPVSRTVYTPNAPTRKRDLRRRKDLKKTQVTTPRAAYRIVRMGDEITVSEFAKQMSVKATEIIKKLMGMGLMVSINSPIDFDTAVLIAGEYKFEVKSTVRSVEEVLGLEGVDSSLETEGRPPIVTVMGHVDHGKTSILDAVRNANVTEGEAGGITQHIGAYTTTFNDKVMTFIDTPGHEAFTSMRARGANITDIVVLVVAADDGVMPQTVEAISHAKAAGVPIIVAVNKIDKPNVNLDRIYTELTEHGIQSEEWGGDTQFVKVSALKRTGIDDLLDAILLQAEVLELAAPVDGFAQGVVIEAHLDKGRGPVATVLVRAGTLKKGQDIVAGKATGRVRAMHDHNGKGVNSAGPSIPVEIIGLASVPMAGDVVNAVEDDKKAREVAELRASVGAGQPSKSSAQSLEDLLAKVKQEDHIEVPVIIKGDTQGSVEAVAEAVKKLSTDKVSTKAIHAAVGGITESDVSLASTSGAVIIGFNVRAPAAVFDHAEHQGVVIKYFSIIYEVVDAVKNIMAGSLPPIVQEVVIGHAEVRSPINIPKIGLIAGSSVTDGKITRQAMLRLIRDDVVVYSGKLGSLKRFKDDVAEVQRGYECGISIDGCNDIREGDVIEAYILEEHAATL